MEKTLKPQTNKPNPTKQINKLGINKQTDVPTVTVHQREYSIVEGSPLSISCHVDSNPPPNLVNWRLVSDGKFFLSI